MVLLLVCVSLLLNNPVHALAFLPLAHARLTRNSRVSPDPVLLTLEPLSVVLATVRPSKLAMALFFVVVVVANILATIRPGKDTLALHFVVCPVTRVSTPILPHVLAAALNVVLYKLPVVSTAVRPRKHTVPMLLALLVDAPVTSSVWPSLEAISVLLVLDPGALVLRPVQMRVNSLTVCLVLKPLSVIDISSRVNQASMPVRLVVIPGALVGASVRPNLHAPAFPNLLTNNPLTRVACPVHHSLHLTLFPWLKSRLKCVVIILKRRKDVSPVLYSVVCQQNWYFLPQRFCCRSLAVPLQP